MRAVFVTSGLDVGGAEFALLRLALGLRDQGVESAVVSLRSIGVVGRLLQAAAIPVAELGLPSAPRAVVAASRLAAFVAEYRAAVVNGWMYHGNLAALYGGWRRDLPVIWGIRQSLGVGARDKWLTRRVIQAGARLSPRADAIVYNSAIGRAQHEAHGYATARGIVMPNGFDTAQLRPDERLHATVRLELGVADDGPVVAQVARFHPVKDYPTFLRAAARLAERLPRAVFVLAGEGVDRSNGELTALIDALGLANRVRLLGRRDDVARLMAGFDVHCLTSVAEAFPNVIGEAMSCGVPCVGTAVGDVAELIGDTGEVVPPSDSEALAAAVGRLLALDPAARRALGARARQRIIERYSIGEVARRYADLLHSVVERHN